MSIMDKDQNQFRRKWTSTASWWAETRIHVTTIQEVISWQLMHWCRFFKQIMEKERIFTTLVKRCEVTFMHITRNKLRHLEIGIPVRQRHLVRVKVNPSFVNFYRVSWWKSLTLKTVASWLTGLHFFEIVYAINTFQNLKNLCSKVLLAEEVDLAPNWKNYCLS